MTRDLNFVLENKASGTPLTSRRGRKIRLHFLQITQRKNFNFLQQLDCWLQASFSFLKLSEAGPKAYIPQFSIVAV